ncbi:hypothetical protein EV652_103395 [Kribbella steppae]|uniref:Uncharacterized protein n=1 Tax=Kribbella steppae TaxID=2512223 RepID=A0A4R2HQC7_9ACTN|nr:hypothetical protein [Kribbella steppae]TCO33394.1 hypothetical protein EV652_103395 [Kribbella steppae]
MFWFVVFVSWLVGLAVCGRRYYKRRCGVEPSPDEPGIPSAAAMSLLWPVVWFIDDWRDPAPCRHSSHARYHHTEEIKQPDAEPVAYIPPAPQPVPEPVAYIPPAPQPVPEPVAYVPPAPQPAPEPVEYVPPPTPAAVTPPVVVKRPPPAPKPAAPSGFEEGDRVRLANPFWGSAEPGEKVLTWDPELEHSGADPTVAAGDEGTILYPDPATAELIAQMKLQSKYLVALDDGRELYSGGAFPGVGGAALERIPGHYHVYRKEDMVYIRPKFNDGDRVTLLESFTGSSGNHFEAGWEGSICPLLVTMTECWETGTYPVNLDDSPSGADRGMVTVRADMIRLAPGGWAR